MADLQKRTPRGSLWSRFTQTNKVKSFTFGLPSKFWKFLNFHHVTLQSGFVMFCGCLLFAYAKHSLLKPGKPCCSCIPAVYQLLRDGRLAKTSLHQRPPRNIEVVGHHQASQSGTNLVGGFSILCHISGHRW